MDIKNTTDAVVLTSMKKAPIETVHLFEPIHEHFMVLLRSLTPEECHQPTIARLWNVKDVTAHLLDTSIRYISAGRDNYRV